MSTSRSAKPAYHHGELREALIGAGLAILDEGGTPANLGLRETARRAGVSAMAPYRHFADKQALLAAVAGVGYERLAAALRAADVHPEPAKALISQGLAYVTFACEHPALFHLMFGAVFAERPPELAAAAQAAFAVLEDRVAGLVPADRAADFAIGRWAIVHGLAALAVDGQLGPDGQAMAERVLRLDATIRGC